MERKKKPQGRNIMACPIPYCSHKKGRGLKKAGLYITID